MCSIFGFELDAIWLIINLKWTRVAQSEMTITRHRMERKVAIDWLGA